MRVLFLYSTFVCGFRTRNDRRFVCAIYIPSQNRICMQRHDTVTKFEHSFNQILIRIAHVWMNVWLITPRPQGWLLGLQSVDYYCPSCTIHENQKVVPVRVVTRFLFGWHILLLTLIICFLSYRISTWNIIQVKIFRWKKLLILYIFKTVYYYPLF